MKRLWLTLFTGSILTLSGLTGCASSPSAESAAEMDSIAPGSGSESAVSEGESADSAATDITIAQASANSANDNSNRSEPSAEKTVAPRPQLIKRAALSLSVESVEDSIRQVREIVNAQQGDVLSMSDRRQLDRNSQDEPSDYVRGDRYQQPTLFEIRIPQDRFNSAVDALAEIGEVEDRSITSEDVSSQLIDLQARISNAKQSEEALKEIMARSGDISDVLEVSRELSNVRQEIEQMGAAQKNLQTQVQYSTISVSLSSAIAQLQTQPAFSRQMANTWKTATSSVGSFTTDLLQLGLWLMVYSPYIAILLCGAAVARKVLRSSTSD